MNTQAARQKWFLCSSPDGLLPRQDAVNLILKHADQVRVFEDLEGYSALMIARNGVRRLVMFTDLTDGQIRDELPGAWLREHQQADMFRDAAARVANDERHAPGPSTWARLKTALSGMFGLR